MRFHISLILLFTLTTLVGCGSSKDHFEYIPVRGSVMLDGKPLPMKSVILFPEEGTSGLGSKGLTNDDGSLELDAVVGGATKVIKGAVPGSYRVMVLDFQIDPGSDEGLQQVQTDRPAAKVPSIYSSSDTTPLRLEVTRDMQDVVLELKSKGR